MRKSLRRAFALACAAPVTAAALVATAPAAAASHDDAPGCGPGSTVLADFFVLGGSHTRIASYDVSNTVRNICVEIAGLGELVVVLESGVAFTPPSVTQTPGAGFCATRIIDMTAPVALSLSVGVSTTGPALCIGQDGETTTISLNSASVQTLPDVDVWTNGFTTINTYLACSDEYANYLAGGSYSTYNTCVTRDNKIA